MMDYEYIGWVPCVSGRLFFEYTHPGLGVPKCLINHVESDVDGASYHRYIIVSSIVDWKDGKENSSTGKYKVFLLGDKTSEDIDLAGKIYITREDINSSAIENVEALIKTIENKVGDEEEIKEDFEKLNLLLGNANNKFMYGVDYIVESPGFAKLKYIKKENTNHSHMYTVIRQAYYYIKYTLHRHRHHHDKAESLTTIHPLTIEKERIGIKLLNDLRKSLVQLKRDFEPYNCTSIYHSSGVASYAKSLAESCFKEGYLDKKEYKSEISYFDNVKSSLEVMAGVVEKDIAKRTMASGNARAIILFALSIIMPVVIAFRDKIAEKTKGTDNFIADMIANIVTSESKIFIAAIMLLAFYWGYMMLKMNHGTAWLSFKYYRDFLEKIVYERFKANLLLMVMLAVSVLFIVYSIRTIFLS